MKAFFCDFMGWHRWVEIAYGFPKWAKHFTTLQECSRCRIRRRYTHDLFGNPRPKDFPIDQDIINFIN